MWAHPSLQESYDNSGLLCGDASGECTGILICLDITEEVLDEAIRKNCNLVVAHHPLIFKPLKRLTLSTPVERCLVKAIRSHISIFALHTNLDNVSSGVSRFLIEQFDIDQKSLTVLNPKKELLAKLYYFVPAEHAERVKSAIFAAGAGKIGQYEHCSFEVEGQGQFKPLDDANPFIGEAGGDLEKVQELKVEAIFPLYLKEKIVNALEKAHPYEAVAYEVIALENEWPDTGSGMLGILTTAKNEESFIREAIQKLNSHGVRHSPLTGQTVEKIAVCGGSGAFLIRDAIKTGANAYITADLKYHDWFEADGKILLIDAGHFETERFAIKAIKDFLQANFRNFAILETECDTNPVRYSRKEP